MLPLETLTAEITSLDNLLTKVSSGSVENNEAERIVSDIVSHCREVREGSGMLFYVLEDPHDMPADARVDFLYRPTYLAAAILISMAVSRPELLSGARAESFQGLLRACTGRNLMGHGYEAEAGLVDSLGILLGAPLKAFLAQHSSEHPEFAECVARAFEELRAICGGTRQPAWGKDEALVRRAKELFSQWENSRVSPPR